MYVLYVCMHVFLCFFFFYLCFGCKVVYIGYRFTWNIPPYSFIGPVGQLTSLLYCTLLDYFVTINFTKVYLLTGTPFPGWLFSSVFTLGIRRTNLKSST